MKVVVRACYAAYFDAHAFKHLAPNFVSGKPEPLIAYVVCNSQHAWAITSVLLLDYRAYPTCMIVSISQFTLSVQ